MMNEKLYRNHLAILRDEMRVAMGCTEPIAIAYAAAFARKVLGTMPEHCRLLCSGNIIKNAKAVTVPNSGGRKGMEAAAVIGITGGDPDRELAVLESVTPEDITLADTLLAADFCTCELAENVANLYVRAEVAGGGHTAAVVLEDHHTHVARIEKDGELIGGAEAADSTFPVDEAAGTDAGEAGADRMLLNIKNILEFAECVDLDEIRDLLEMAIAYNSAISAEGLKGGCGMDIGRTLMEKSPTYTGRTNARLRARALAAAGSDARMSGVSLPVVINSGSGNQGITVTMPILVYAEEYGTDHDTMLRALVIGNLISVHQKKYIGSLSAYCGATSAATASVCGIAYMYFKKTHEEERTYKVVCDILTNSLETIGGMVCDGAKASCAAKISIAVENAMMAFQLANTGHVFQPGEGMTMEDPEETIAAVGRMGRVGMKSTDVEILKIMLGQAEEE